MRMVPATLAVLVLACQAHLAFAQDEAPQSHKQCGPYKDIAAHLLEKYGESPVAEAIVSAGDGVLIVFASPRGRTWTTVVADSKGEKGCLLVSGEQWVTIHVAPHMTGPGI